MKKKLLLHTCCAPCLVGTLPEIAMEEDFEITCYWYNPNIHPCTEYKARRDALIGYAKKNGIELLVRDHYGLREFVRHTIEMDNLAERCGFCYGQRLGETARQAKEGGYGAFSTTLLVSPYQNREKIREAGEKAAKEHGVEFFCGDYRASFREGQKLAREGGVYMQKYCGCIFSEEERFFAKTY